MEDSGRGAQAEGPGGGPLVEAEAPGGAPRRRAPAEVEAPGGGPWAPLRFQCPLLSYVYLCCAALFF